MVHCYKLFKINICNLVIIQILYEYFSLLIKFVLTKIIFFKGYNVIYYLLKKKKIIYTSRAHDKWRETSFCIWFYFLQPNKTPPPACIPFILRRTLRSSNPQSLCTHLSTPISLTLWFRRN